MARNVKSKTQNSPKNKVDIITTDASEFVEEVAVEEPVNDEKNIETDTGKTEEVEEKFDFLTEILCTDKIVQIMICLATCHLFYFQQNENARLTGTIVSTLVSFAVVLVVYIRSGTLKISFDNFDKNYFNLLYLIILPIGLTFYYVAPAERYLSVNCTLLLNYLPVPTYLKIPLQGSFTLINGDPAYSENDKFLALSSIVLNSCICFILEQVSHLKSLSFVECNLFSILLTNVLHLYQGTSLQFQVLQKSLWALIIIFTVNWLIDTFVFKYRGNVRKAFFLGSTALGFPSLLQFLLNRYQGELFNNNPVAWLFDYVTNDSTKLTILSVWMSFLAFLIPSIFSLKSVLSLNTSRKIWHFIVFALIAIPFKYDSEFVKFSVSGVIPLFLLVEYLRYINVLGAGIDKHLSAFSDYRDSAGPIIISYLYLIIGVSFPLLVNDDLSGCIVLGVGDALASIVGKKFGKTYWDGPDNKTTEGTSAFVVSTFIVSIILKIFYLDGDYTSVFSDSTALFELFANCFVAGVLEGNASFNDNILLPGFTMVFSKVLKL